MTLPDYRPRRWGLNPSGALGSEALAVIVAAALLVLSLEF